MDMFFEVLKELYTGNADNVKTDQIIMAETLLETSKINFKAIEKGQAFLVNQYKNLKTKSAKKVFEQIIAEGYTEMQNIDKQIEEAEKNLQKIKML